MKLVSLFLAALLPAFAYAKVKYYTSVLNGGQSDVGCPDTEAIGNAVVSLRDGKLCVFMGYTNLSGPEIYTHIHGPALVNIKSPIVNFVLSDKPVKNPSTGDCFEVDHKMEKDLDKGLWYFNVHSELCPDGEIRGQIFPIAQYP